MKPGDGMMHPLALLAMVALAVNDHWAKAVFDNWWTGKISDVAGLFFFPLLMQAVLEWLRFVKVGSLRVLGVNILLTALVFTAIKVWQPAGVFYCWIVGVLQAPMRWVEGNPVTPVRLVRDWTDLGTLPVLAGTWWLGVRRSAPGSP